MRLYPSSIVVAALLGLTVASFPLSAQLPTGRDFRVRDDGNGRQVDPRAAAAPDGRFAVTWTTEVPFPQEGDVKVRLFDAQGRPRGAEFVVAATAAHRQAFPAIAMAPNGAFVVTWIETPRDSSASEVFARVFGPGGRPKGPAFRVAESTARKLSADVAIGSDGSFVVAWDEEQVNPRLGAVFARRFDAGGAPLGPDLPFDPQLASAFAPRVAVNPRTGDFAITCMVSRVSLFDILVRRFFADGSPAGPQFIPYDASGAAVLRTAPAIALAADGRLGVVWSDPSLDPDPLPPNNPAVVARRFTDDDQPLGPVLQLDRDILGFQGLPSIAALAGGAFLAVWDSGADGLLGRILGPAASSRNRLFRIGQRPGGAPFTPALGMAPTGRGVVVWNELGPGTRIQLFARRLAPEP